MSIEFLKGIKVVELSIFIAAPTAARMLAEWGAEVVKVEGVGGDPIRYTGADKMMPVDQNEDPVFDFENNAKRGICLNLKTARGMEAFMRLLDGADIFITNLRAQALEKLGIGYEALHARYPGIIFAQVFGYGINGPLKDKPGYDFTAYAARGGFSGTLYEKGTSPVNVTQGFGDHPTGMYLAAGILAAYINKLRTGRGEMVSTSLYQTAVFNQAVMILSAQYGNRFPISRRDALNPIQTNYATSDGRWIQLCIPEYNKHIRKFCEAVGRPEWADDARFASLESVASYAPQLNDLIFARLREEPLAYWAEVFERADLCFEICQSFEEIVEDEQAWANDMLYMTEYPTREVAMINNPVTFREGGGAARTRGPKLGQHTDEILAGLGYSAEAIAEMKANKEVR